MREGTCKSFRGIQHKTCEKGINMREATGGGHVGWANRMPCMTGGDEKRAHCLGYEPPTKGELAKQEASFEEMFHAVRIARERIVSANTAASRKGMVLHVICPVCKESLVGSVSSNGHVHGRCSTEGCLRWME